MKDLHLFLKQVSIFRELEEAEIAAVAEKVHKRTYREGDYLFHDKTLHNELFIVYQGKVEIVRNNGNSKEVIARFGEQNFVGEEAILGEALRTTACRAVIDTDILVIEQQDMNTLLSSSPETAKKILLQVARILACRSENKIGNYNGSAITKSYNPKTRKEHDLLGERSVPADVYYGIQTLRATENYNVSGMTLSQFPALISALAMVKKAASISNCKLGDLDENISTAICTACDEIIEGEWHNQFVVDMIQGGAGTSTNMNANEVIANRALEVMGLPKGDYQSIHPNTHVNQSQSTNDVYPTAVRLAILLSYKKLTDAMESLAYEMKQKAVAFSDVIKMGRTQLQDAVPMTLGQEFDAFKATIKEDVQIIKNTVKLFQEVNLGATAIGTGITARPEFSNLAIEELSRIAAIELVPAENFVESVSDMGAFVMFSGVLKRIAVKLSKICNDLRLLSSGPRTGLNEINLPPIAPGSSIMPGKVNPVIPEMVNQVAFQVIGNDLTITFAAEAGQLQLNVMEPVIVFNIFKSVDILTRAIKTLTERCIKGITANRDHCRKLVENSIGIATALLPYIGYENATRISREALNTGRGVMDLVLKAGLLNEKELTEILTPEKMTRPQDHKAVHGAGPDKT